MFQMKRFLGILVSLATLSLLLIGIVAADHDLPLFLDTSVPADNEDGIPAADGYTYRFWYTRVCPSEVNNAPCDCDDVPDIDTDDDGVPDQDSFNDCIADEDTDGDGQYDKAQDKNNNNVPDVIDVDWRGRQSGEIESVVRRFTDTLQVYVVDWGFRAPVWLDVHTDENVERNRRIWLQGSDHSGSSRYGIRLTPWQTMKKKPRSIVLHETWHSIQHAYYPENRRQVGWIHEGQAKSIEDKVFPELERSNHYAYDLLLENPTYTKQVDTDDDDDVDAEDGYKAYGLFMIGPKGVRWGYNAALWWTYFVEQFGDDYPHTPGEGMDAMRTFWEQVDAGLDDTDAVDAAIAAETNTSVRTFEDAYRDFVIANYAKELDVSRIPRDDLDERDPVATLRYRDEGRGTLAATHYYTSTKLDVDLNLVLGNTQTGHVNAHVANLDADEEDDSANDPPTWAMPAWGARYYRGSTLTGCPVAGVRIEGGEGARLAFALLAVKPDSDGDGVKEADRLIRSVGQDFAAAVWNGSNQYDHIALVVAGLDTPYGYDYTLGCTLATPEIVHPTTADREHVGAPGEPERFLVWVKVTGQAPIGAPAVAGLDWQRDFEVFVGPANIADNQATILDGGYVMDTYWLVVQAPDKDGAPYGSVYNLTVRLGGILGATQEGAVVYDVVRTDRVLVIDRSGSMAGEKIVAAKAAARLYTEDLFPGDRLGVISFRGVATRTYPSPQDPDALGLLEPPDGQPVRQEAQAAIDLIQAGGSTSIGDGLWLAQDQLDDVASDNEWWMVLLSDGMENTPPLYADVRGRLIDAGTKVHAIALGDGAHEDLMRSIAIDTCGEEMLDVCYHHFPEPVAVASSSGRDIGFLAAAQPLINRLADLYTEIAEDIAGHDRLWENNGSVPPNDSVELSVVVQEPGIKDAIFSFHWEQPGALTVVLRDPGGAVVEPGPGVVRLDDHRGPNHVVWQIADLSTGTWTAMLTAAGDTAVPYIASLSGRQTDGTQLRVFLDRTVGDRWVGLPLPILANLTDHKGQVRRAFAQAEISHPDGRLDTLDLFDDGAHGDGVAGDGTYANFYTRITHIGSYDIRVIASGSNNDGHTFTRYAHLSYLAVPDPTQGDPDGDGLPTRWEERFGLNPFIPTGRDGAAGDPDQDNLANLEEFLTGANPIDADSDRGGETDGSELTNGRNPLDGRDDVVRPPRDVWVEPGDGRNDIHFSRNATCANLHLERTTDLVAGFTLQGDFDPTSGPIGDTGLVNGTLYYYRLRCDGVGGSRSRFTYIVQGRPKTDTVPPGGDVLINEGAEHTEDLNVTLSLVASPDAIRMQISNRADFRGAPWIPFATSVPWTLLPDPRTGEAMVYAQFQDGFGNISPVAADSIRYQPPQEIVIQAAGGVLDSPEGRIYLVVPPGALPADAIFRYTWLERPPDAPAGHAYAGAHFRLEARRVADDTPITQFNVPVQLRLIYQDYEWQNGPVAAETTLDLFRRTGASGWEALAGSVDPTGNQLTVALNNLSEFGLFGQTPLRAQTYLPLLLKNF